MDHPNRAQRSPVSLHDGHNPNDPRVVVVEDLAMVMCSCCSDGELRWRDRDCPSVFWHSDITDVEGSECEAARMLDAACDLGVPIYTGAELEFEDAA